MLKNSARSRIVYLILLFSIFYTNNVISSPSPPPLPLAQVYKEGKINLKDYWLSEKLDGVRAYWDGKQFLSKLGNRYHAPEWFIANFPNYPLDGELWIARNSFNRVVSIVQDNEPGPDWHQVRYMVFDLPLPNVTFTERLEKLKTLLATPPSPYLQLVEQSQVPDHISLMKKLNEIVDSGGEGLMLHRGGAYYQAGRSNDLLKVKTYQDAEARVIAHLPGKGKYSGMLGALLVETEDKKQFRLGTGFSDQQRRQPPAIGTLVSYKYFGKTARGLPRFPSFLRIRKLK